MVVKMESWEHLQKHIVYPATRNNVLDACNRMTDVPQEDRERFEKNVPDWYFRNADEVVRAVQLSEHLSHVSYPITRKELRQACNKMSEVPKTYREWFERSIPEGTYNKAEDILGILKAITHVREHVVYPATKSRILETCSKMTEVPEVDRELFNKYLPERDYRNPDDVIKAFKM